MSPFQGVRTKSLDKIIAVSCRLRIKHPLHPGVQKLNKVSLPPSASHASLERPPSYFHAYFVKSTNKTRLGIELPISVE